MNIIGRGPRYGDPLLFCSDGSFPFPRPSAAYKSCLGNLVNNRVTLRVPNNDQSLASPRASGTYSFTPFHDPIGIALLCDRPVSHENWPSAGVWEQG